MLFLNEIFDWADWNVSEKNFAGAEKIITFADHLDQFKTVPESKFEDLTQKFTIGI